jgi:hypothetical protein
VSLAALDRSLPARRSLAPGRARATPLAALAARCFAALSGAERALREELLGRIAIALAEDYPDNVFCDLDALAGRLGEGAREDAEALAGRVVALSRAFGGAGPLRFRYVHDFLYGLDWCRWAAKDPADRAGADPYGARFLGYLAARGEELVALVAAGDAKYGPLAAGAFRNPFGFSREPGDEARILALLAAEGALPFACWEVGAGARLVPFVEARLAVAARLGLLREAPG